jgi:long-chain acyl-CoA synthetase
VKISWSSHDARRLGRGDDRRMNTTALQAEAGAPRTLDGETLCEAFRHTAAKQPTEVALADERHPAGVSWYEYAERVRGLAEGLHSLGLRRGDTLALLLSNRVEFNLLDAAAIHLGAVPFSVYATSAPEQIEYVLRDSGARLAVTETALHDRLTRALALSERPLDALVLVDGERGTLTLDELELRRSPGFDFEASWRAVGPDDLLTLIYTSGTTGPPKGVELTHRNLLASWRGMYAAWEGPRQGGATISYLPSAHIADRFACHYAGMLFGLAVTSCPDPRRVAQLLPEVRPTVFVAVPRVWQKLKAGIEAVIGSEPDPARRQAIAWALETGRRAVEHEQRGEPLPEELRAERQRAEELVLVGIRRRLGLDRCETAVCAAAPVPGEVLAFFHALGLPVLEVYGLSETSAVVAANPPARPKIGTVGTPVPGVELRLADDGEVLVRGDLLMRGYRNRPDKTGEAIDPDGWLHTGDVGVLDEDGYLTIVDRKKELIINAAGKNMSPANIESTLKGASGLIGQACVIGDARPYNVALLTPDADASAALTPEALRAEIGAAVERANERLSRPEQIKSFRLLENDWLPGGAELTPTMKLKRRAIAKLYADEIEALYAPR